MNAKKLLMDAQFDDQLRKGQQHHRKMFMKLLQAIQYVPVKL